MYQEMNHESVYAYNDSSFAILHNLFFSFESIVFAIKLQALPRQVQCNNKL